MNREKVVLIVCIVAVLFVGGFFAFGVLNKNYMVELEYDGVIEKIESKESFVLLLSQTTCSHCAMYKPKLKRVANKYKVKIYYLETDLITDAQKDALKKYFSFNGTPTTVFIIDGKEKTAASRINGDVSEDKIISKLKNNGFIK